MNSGISPGSGSSNRRMTGRDPLETARVARRAVGLGNNQPIRDICGLLEENGVKLLLLGTKRDLVLRVERRSTRRRTGRGRQYLGADFCGAVDLHSCP